MPETITKEITVFKFDELTDIAKQRAITDYCEHGMHHEWWDDVHASAIADGIERGFDIEDIRFSGFWSQGDGASWTGTVRADTFLDYHLKEDDPDHARYIVLRELIRDGWIEPRLEVRTGSFHYCHSGTMVVEWELGSSMPVAPYTDDEGYQCTISTEHSILHGANVDQLAKGIEWEALCESLEDWVKREVRAYADGIYKNLQTEYDWLTSEEQIADMAEANDWRFDEDGVLV